MARKLKFIGIVLAAVLAMSAVVSSAAHAAAWTATSYPAILTGDQDGGTTKFVIGKEVRTITCKQTVYQGTITAATESPSITPTYGECSAAPGALTVHINSHKCTWRWPITIIPPRLHWPIDTCPPTTNKETGHGPFEIIITFSLGEVICSYSISEQEVPGTTTWTNKAGPPEDVTVEFNINPVTTVTTGSAIACGAAAGKTVSASVVGSSTIRAFKDSAGAEGEQVGVMIG